MSESDAASERRERYSPGRLWMPTVAGVLDICAGASSIIGSAVLAFLAMVARSIPRVVDEPMAEWPFEMGFAMFFGLATLLVVLGVLAVTGGIQALRHRRGYWPIIGAIMATLSCFPLGIPAIILTVIYEHELPSSGTAGSRNQRTPN